MVSVEWEEGGQLHPPVAQFFVCVAVETACVDTEHGDSTEREGERLRDREEHVRPERSIISSPVTSPFSRSGKSGSCNDEWAFGWEDVEDSMIRGVDNLMSEEIVEIVFLCSTVMGGIGEDSMDAQCALDIVYGVGWILDISNTGSWSGALVDCGSSRCRWCGS